MKFLVVDSGAFIKAAPVHEYAEEIYTVAGVVKEIKDKATRQRLQFLPYKLHIKDPSPEIYKHVLEFSKKTGDFATLSITDLQVIALTYQLEKENVGTDHLNNEPKSKNTLGYPSQTNTQISRFYCPSDDEEETKELQSTENYDSFQDKDQIIHGSSMQSIEADSEITSNSECQKVNIQLADRVSEEKVISDSCQSSDEASHSDNEASQSDNDGEDDNDEGWITPSNLSQIQKEMGCLTMDDTADATVACITTDFSIQNMLLQMGLHVVSVDGLLIKRINVFILRCHACYKLTSDMTKKFCPNCGNKTLKRVSMTCNEDGTQTIHINFKRPINIRGTRYSLPTPRGGRHAVNPVLCEDQPSPHNRPTKMSIRKINVMGDNYDYQLLTSPFAENDVYSRASRLGLRPAKSGTCKNPNVWSKRTGNKKKK